MPFVVGDRVEFYDSDSVVSGTGTVAIVLADGVNLVDDTGVDRYICINSRTYPLDTIKLLAEGTKPAGNKESQIFPAASEAGYFDRKFDSGKADWSLLPAQALNEIVVFDSQDTEERPEGDTPSVAAAVTWFASWAATGNRDDLAGCFQAWRPDHHIVSLLAEVVDVLMYGAAKYAPESWRQVPDAQKRYTNAAWRHLEAMASGEKYDYESGKSHLGHFLCNVVFLLELTRP